MSEPKLPIQIACPCRETTTLRKIQDDDGRIIASHLDQHVAEAFVTSCNAHQELVEMVKNLIGELKELDAIGCDHEAGICNFRTAEVVSEAEQLLAKVEVDRET